MTNVNYGARNEKMAKKYFKLYPGRLKFRGKSSLFLSCDRTEEEFIFSHALAKFQNLVRFED